MTVFPNPPQVASRGRPAQQPRAGVRTLVARRVQIHKARPHPGAPKLSGHRGSYINALSRFVSHLSLLSRRYQILRTGPGASVVFHDPDNAYDSRGRYCAADIGYFVPGSSWRFHPAPQDCALDAAALVIRFGNRCNCLPDALPDLSFVIIGC